VWTLEDAGTAGSDFTYALSADGQSYVPIKPKQRKRSHRQETGLKSTMPLTVWAVISAWETGENDGGKGKGGDGHAEARPLRWGSTSCRQLCTPRRQSRSRGRPEAVGQFIRPTVSFVKRPVRPMPAEK
jgi:hypothetical protein